LVWICLSRTHSALIWFDSFISPLADRTRSWFAHSRLGFCGLRRCRFALVTTRGCFIGCVRSGRFHTALHTAAAPVCFTLAVHTAPLLRSHTPRFYFSHIRSHLPTRYVLPASALVVSRFWFAVRARHTAVWVNTLCTAYTSFSSFGTSFMVHSPFSRTFCYGWTYVLRAFAHFTRLFFFYVYRACGFRFRFWVLRYFHVAYTTPHHAVCFGSALTSRAFLTRWFRTFAWLVATWVPPPRTRFGSVLRFACSLYHLRSFALYLCVHAHVSLYGSPLVLHWLLAFVAVLTSSVCAHTLHCLPAVRLPYLPTRLFAHARHASHAAVPAFSLKVFAVALPRAGCRFVYNVTSLTFLRGFIFMPRSRFGCGSATRTLHRSHFVHVSRLRGSHTRTLHAFSHVHTAPARCALRFGSTSRARIHLTPVTFGLPATRTFMGHSHAFDARFCILHTTVHTTIHRLFTTRFTHFRWFTRTVAVRVTSPLPRFVAVTSRLFSFRFGYSFIPVPTRIPGSVCTKFHTRYTTFFYTVVFSVCARLMFVSFFATLMVWFCTAHCAAWTPLHTKLSHGCIFVALAFTVYSFCLTVCGSLPSRCAVSFAFVYGGCTMGAWI